MALGLMSLSSSCNKNINNPEPQEGVCNTKDPLKDLPWLKSRIDSSTNSSDVLEIYSYDFQGNKIFSITIITGKSPGYQTYNGGYYNCEGNRICEFSSAFTVINTCSKSLTDKLTTKKLIYRK